MEGIFLARKYFTGFQMCVLFRHTFGAARRCPLWGRKASSSSTWEKSMASDLIELSNFSLSLMAAHSFKQFGLLVQLLKYPVILFRVFRCTLLFYGVPDIGSEPGFSPEGEEEKREGREFTNIWRKRDQICDSSARQSDLAGADRLSAQTPGWPPVQ